MTGGDGAPERVGTVEIVGAKIYHSKALRPLDPSLGGDVPLPTDPSETAPSTAAADRAEVADVLQQLRSGVRQRVAELAAVPSDSGGTRAKLIELRAREFVREPTPFSHRARLGRLIVWTRKAVYHLFLKWFTRPLVEQQNAFNQASSALSQELAARQEELTRRLELLQHRVERLEHPEPTGGARP